MNPEPLDELFLGSDLPFVVKACLGISESIVFLRGGMSKNVNSFLLMTFALRKMICLIAGFGEHDSQTKMLLVELRMFIQNVQESKGDSM